MTTITDGERRFRSLADNAPVMIWRSDRAMSFDYFNQPWLEFTGRTLEQEQGSGWATGVHPDDHAQRLATYEEALAQQKPFTMRYRLRRADGAYRWLLDNARPHYDPAGDFAGYFGSCVDVTDMIEAQEALERANAEKSHLLDQRDALLHEVHHRVRNNLQLIISILELQSRNAEPVARDALTVVAGRVRSIAAAQSLVSNPTDGAEIDVGAYMSALAAQASPIGATDRPAVRCAAEPARMPLGRAAPLGLAVNELLACVSDAGQAEAPEPIEMAVRREGESLTIAIASPVTPEALDKAIKGSRSLGWRLIERLVAQAGGKVTRDHAGALFHIALPAKP
jgi:PAS domain S-box-containing protein